MACATPLDADPSTPTNVASSAGNQWITLSWSANTEPDLQGYRVSRANSVTGPFTVLIPLQTSTTYTDLGTVNGQTYYYRIEAIDQSAQVSLPAQLSASSATLPPYVIYGDALRSTYGDSSWSGTYNWASTNPVYAGTHALRASYSAWGGIQIGGSWPLNTPKQDLTGYSHFEMAVRPAQTNSPILVGLCDWIHDVGCNGDWNPLVANTYVPGGLVANQWNIISIPLTDFNIPSNQVNFLVLMNNQDVATVVSYDDIQIVSRPVSSSQPLAIVVQPQNQSALVGATATFAVTAAGSGITYRWQSKAPSGGSFADIAAATSALYTTNVLTLANNATQFRVIVSNSTSSITSTPATLLVSA